MEEIKADPNAVRPFALNLADYLERSLGDNLALNRWCICTTPRRRHQTGFHFATEICRLAEEELGIPREDAAMLLPLGMCTKIVDKRNLRNLIDMSHQRMCTRTYWEYRELFRDISNALRDISEEWAYIVDHFFVPKCELTGFCPEKKGCGRKPKKA